VYYKYPLRQPKKLVVFPFYYIEIKTVAIVSDIRTYKTRYSARWFANEGTFSRIKRDTQQGGLPMRTLFLGTFCGTVLFTNMGWVRDMRGNSPRPEEIRRFFNTELASWFS